MLDYLVFFKKLSPYLLNLTLKNFVFSLLKKKVLLLGVNSGVVMELRRRIRRRSYRSIIIFHFRDLILGFETQTCLRRILVYGNGVGQLLDLGVVAFKSLIIYFKLLNDRYPVCNTKKLFFVNIELRDGWLLLDCFGFRLTLSPLHCLRIEIRQT